VVLQNAETVRLVQPDGSLLAVTAAKPGDRILVHIAEAAARHFGTAVDEFILER
jgi:3-dehydroquinate synthase II